MFLVLIQGKSLLPPRKTLIFVTSFGRSMLAAATTRQEYRVKFHIWINMKGWEKSAKALMEWYLNAKIKRLDRSLRSKSS